MKLILPTQNGKIKFIKFERKKGNKRIFKCPYDHCLKFFAQSGNLRTHLRTHTGLRPFVCNQCDKSFITKGHLISHELTHSGERPYACHFQGCNKSYSRSGRLKIHMRSHTGQKPYRCDFQNCDKAFTERGNLKTHMRIHVGIKPHQCNICGKKFVTNGHLKDHIKTHSNAKPFACGQCGKKYKRITTMHIHMKNCHNIQMGRNIEQKQNNQLKKEIFSDEFLSEEEDAYEQDDILLQQEKQQQEQFYCDFLANEKQLKELNSYDQEDLNIDKKKLIKQKKARKDRCSISKSLKQSQKICLQTQKLLFVQKSPIKKEFTSSQDSVENNQISFCRQISPQQNTKLINHSTIQPPNISRNKHLSCKLQESKKFSQINQPEQKLPLLTQAQKELIKLRRQASVIDSSSSNRQPTPLYCLNKPQEKLYDNNYDRLTPQSNSLDYYQNLFNNNFAPINVESNIKFQQLMQGNYSASNSPFNSKINSNLVPQTVNPNFGNPQARTHMNQLYQNLRQQNLQYRGTTSLTPQPQSSQHAFGSIEFSTSLQNYLIQQNQMANKVSSVSPNSGVRNLSQINFPLLYSTPKGPYNSFYSYPGLNNSSAFKQIIATHTENGNRMVPMNSQLKITPKNNSNLSLLNAQSPSDYHAKVSSSSPGDHNIGPNSFSNCLMRDNSLHLGYSQNSYHNPAPVASKLNLFDEINQQQQQQQFRLQQHQQQQEQQQQLQQQQLQQQQLQQQQQLLQQLQQQQLLQQLQQQQSQCQQQRQMEPLHNHTPPQKQNTQIMQTPFGGNSVINMKNKLIENKNSRMNNYSNQVMQPVYNFATELSKLGSCQLNQQLSSSSNVGNKMQLTFEEMSKYVTQAIQSDQKYK